MLINIQHLFKPADMAPTGDGREMCVCKGLTDYCTELGVPAFATQVWEGEGEDAHVVQYLLIDKNTKQVIFADRRYQVCEYIIENISEQLQSQKEEGTP